MREIWFRGLEIRSRGEQEKALAILKNVVQRLWKVTEKIGEDYRKILFESLLPIFSIYFRFPRITSLNIYLNI